MLSVYLLDSKQKDLQRLSIMLRQPQAVDVVGMSTDPYVAMNEIDLTQPDALFLDIHLRGLNGLEVVDRVRQKNPGVLFVFATENQNCALLAFEKGVLDYVKKPLEQERLNKTLARLQAVLAFRGEH